MSNTVTQLNTDWQQISGDVAASEYGAMFGRLDASGDTVYGVYVVQVINMPDACGSDWDSTCEGGDYVAEYSYVDVDNLDWHTARRILDSCGWSTRLESGTQVAIDSMPDDVRVRYDWLVTHILDMNRLALWTGVPWTASERDDVSRAGDEADTLIRWYSIDRMARAEMSVSYGGYSDGQSLTFPTLHEAMEYHGIPASALWQASEYEN